MGHPSRSLEDRRAESYVVCGGQDQEVSEGNNISSYIRDWSYDNLVKKNMAAF